MGAWTHLVGTYDATNMTMSFYINGALVLQETNINVRACGHGRLATASARRSGGN